MNSREPAKELDAQVEVLCRLLAEIVSRIMSQQGVDRKPESV